jgi:MFS family permease
VLASSIAPWLTRRGIHYGWVMVALTFVTTLSSSAAVSLTGVMLVPMTQEFGWAKGDVSAAMGLLFIMFAATAPFAGALILRYGQRQMVVVAATMVTVALLGTTLASARWHVLVSLGLILGTAAGLGAMALNATVANRWFAQRRGLAMGILTASFAAGQLSFMPGAAWIAANYGWRAAVLPAIVAAGTCAVLNLLFARNWPADLGLAPLGETVVQRPALGSAGGAVAVSFAVLREAAATRVFWVLAGTFFICGLSTTGIVNTHFIPFCGDNGVLAVAAASYLAMMGVFNFTGTIVSGWLSDRFDNRVLLAWYYGLRGLSLIWLPFSNFDFMALSVFAIFFGLDFVATVPPTAKLAAQHFGSAKAPIVFGWIFAAHQLGGAVSAYTSGLTRDAWATYMPAFLAIGVICLVASGAVFGVRDIRVRGVAAE